jgi:hypothetical protein
MRNPLKQRFLYVAEGPSAETITAKCHSAPPTLAALGVSAP